MTDLSRRRFLSFAPLIVAAPAIVRASSLMPIKAIRDSGWAFDPYRAMYVQLSLGYAITREALIDNLYNGLPFNPSALAGLVEGEIGAPAI